MKKIALVTGISRGIGKSIALRLSSDGFDIWGVYRKNDELAIRVKEEIEKQGSSCTMLKFDVSSYNEAEKALKPQIEKLDRSRQCLWAVVNNAGITNDVLFAWMNWQQWNDVISTNLSSVYIITKLVSEELLRQKGGRIINITSVAARIGNTGQVNYSASKAGIIGFTKSLAREMARMKITVNAIAAGFIETDMTSNLPIEEIKKTIPMRRLGKPEEVAAVVSFLCREESSYVTGAVIDVNGGIY